MKDKIKRSVRVEDDKVFAVTRTENDNNGLLQIKTLENEISESPIALEIPISVSELRLTSTI